MEKVIKNIVKKYLKENIKPNNINKNFWKWFGNSKVVKNGKPMVVYHGSPNKYIKIFNLGSVGKNTDSGMFGKGFYFTDNVNYASNYERGMGGKIFSCYLSLQNPLIINDKNDIPEINTPDETLEDLYNSPENYSKMFREYLINNGYDGVIDNIGNEKQFVVIHPNQIKSIDNDGSWDIKNNNIYS
jgi:hypothetical protein